jgi:hypothetical protein
VANDGGAAALFRNARGNDWDLYMKVSLRSFYVPFFKGREALKEREDNGEPLTLITE